VSKASVSVNGKEVGKIGKGLFVLVGVGKDDMEKDAEELATKLSKLRIMSDENDKMNLSVGDVNASILAASQFTLHADTRKGNRPSFIKAADPKFATKLYNLFVEKLRELEIQVETGEFGEYMMIDAVLDGPVTIYLDSRN
jgi:D-tyrosyl-tRNA(Tyr) deacylase